MRSLHVPSAYEMSDCDCVLGHEGEPIERADPQRALRPFRGTFRLTGVGQYDAAEEKCEGGGRAECMRPLEPVESGSAVESQQSDDERAKSKRRRIVATLSDGSPGMADGRGAIVLVVAGSHEEDLMAPREHCVRTGIVWFQ